MRTTPDRLTALRELLVLDTAPETVYDDLTRLLAAAFDVPIAMVNLLDADRDWFKSCIGLPFSESPAATSFCEAFFRSADPLMVVSDTTLDPRFADHALVVNAPFIRFYASTRLLVGGQTVGTLCVYDLKPRAVTEVQIETLQALGRAAMQALETRKPVDAAPGADPSAAL